jgi:SEC-C motif
MHVQVVQEQAPAPVPEQLVTQESGPAEPGTDGDELAISAASSTAALPAAPAPAAPKKAPTRAPARGAAPQVQNLRTSSSDDVAASGFQRAAAAGGEAAAEILRSSGTATIDEQAGGRQGNRPAKQETVVKDEWSKTPRNAPCPCGSGKKFKMCHGA